MKLIIKNLKQKEYNVEVESDKVTVRDLKVKIEEKYKFDSETLKLLHNGQILDDDQTLDFYDIKDQNVLIVMNTRVKSNVPHEIPKANIEPTTPKYPNYDPQIESLVTRGYERYKAEKAVYAARGNVDLAVEFLSRAGVYPKGQEPPGYNLPEEVKKNISLIKVLCARDPSKIINILNNLKSQHPSIIEKIKENEAEVKAALVSPINLADVEQFREFQQELRQMESMGGMGGLGGMGPLGAMGGGGRRPGQIEIRLTKEEGEAIKRLKDLTNCTQAEVIQAFLACDKNEELAANYLFEQKMNDDGNDNNQGQGP